MTDRTRFRHVIQLRVRNYEIDWQGIVHNAVYLHYFETGRVAYLENLGLELNIVTIRNESHVVVARNEIDYDSPARFGELLNVFTRISVIGTTSFTFEGIIDAVSTGRLIARNVAVHVWLEKEGGKPIRVPDEFRAMVARFDSPGDAGVPA